MSGAAVQRKVELVSDGARQHALSMAYICDRRASVYPPARAAEAAELRGEAAGWRSLAAGEVPDSPTDEQLEWLESAGADDIR